jgi:predicted Zn-dependent protease
MCACSPVSSGTPSNTLKKGCAVSPIRRWGQLLLGSLNLRLRKFAEAEGALRRTIQLDPMMAQARLQLVNLLVKQGRKQDAASQLRDFVSTFPASSFSPQAKQLLQKLEEQPKSAAGVPN